MIKVFIGGSISIKTLPGAVAARIDKMIENGLSILIGDAPGADRCVQEYLAARRYKQVCVFHSGPRCRNNLGGWPTQSVSARPDLKGAAFYGVKDVAMAEEATHGLMIWDGESRGTLNNIRNLLLRGRVVVVFLSPDGPFYALCRGQDLAIMPVGSNQ